MLMHKRDSKGTIKFDFIITSCLVFRSSIPTILSLKKNLKQVKKFRFAKIV